MPERDNRPPQLVLPVIAPGGKPDSVAFNNAFQLWARDLNAWLNDNLAPAAESKPATSAQPTAHKLLYRGTEYTHPGPADDCTSRFCVDEDSLPRPEWLPDDFEARVGLIARSKIEISAAAVGEAIEKLVAASYDEWLVRMGRVDSRSAAPYWMRRAERAEAECDKAIQERDEALKAKRYAEAKTVTAIQDLDELLSDPAHLSVGDAGRIAREHVHRAQAAETALAIALQERDAEAEENRTGMEILADIKAAFPEHVRHQYGPDAVRGIVATLDETHKRAEAAEAKVARVEALIADGAPSDIHSSQISNWYIGEIRKALDGES